MKSFFARQRPSVKLFAALMTLGAVGAVTTAVLLKAEPSHLVPILLAELALIFLSALLIERALLSEFNDNANARAKQMTERVSEGIRDYFQTEFAVLKYANEYGVSLVPPRRSLSKNPGVTYAEFASAISRARRIVLFCTSGIDVFPPVNAGASAVFEALRDRALDATRQLTITILSCDPNGDYAKVRGALEDRDNPSYIKRDVSLAHDTFKALMRACAGSKVPAEWFIYDFVPQMWFLLTETEAFAEIYHFGLNRRAPRDAASCLGGRIPLLRVNAGSGLWHALDEYVNFLTISSADSTLEEIRTNYFKVRPY